MKKASNVVELNLNKSGIEPTEFKVLIKPKTVEEKTAGGIIIPDESKDREQFAQMEGELVAVSPLAFTYADWKDGSPPKPGNRVLFAKFAGAKVKGRDSVEYRIVNDKDIAAVLS
jgi:chaperonin GroES